MHDEEMKTTRGIENAVSNQAKAAMLINIHLVEVSNHSEHLSRERIENRKAVMDLIGGVPISIKPFQPSARLNLEARKVLGGFKVWEKK